MNRRYSAVLVPLVTVLSACGGQGKSGGDVDAGAPFARDKLLDPTTCNECHPKHYDEWSGSMHAYASTDPVFRKMNERGQKETGGQLGDFCVKCHAPMAVQEKATTDGTNLDSVPQALQGITCYFCHQVTDVQGAHNNPLLLANDTTMRGGIKNPLPYKAHSSRYSSLHDEDNIPSSASLCGSCHDIVVPGHFSGATSDAGASKDVALERTYVEWQGSVFSDPKGLLPFSCGRCHITPELNVPIASPPEPHPTMPVRAERHMHDFPAVDTALVDFPNREKQLASVGTLLDDTLRVETCASTSIGQVNLTLENLSVGHNFPSGASQDRRLWVELHAYKDGTELNVAKGPRGVRSLGSGAIPPGGVVTDQEATTWILRDQTFKADGVTPAHMFWDIAVVNPASGPALPTIPVATPAAPANVAAQVYYVFAANGNVAVPDRVSATVWLEPIGLDVLRDMAAAGYPVTGGDAGAPLVIPRFTLLPNRGSPADAGVDPNVTLDWNVKQAEDPTIGYDNGDLHCMQTSQKPPIPVGAK